MRVTFVVLLLAARVGQAAEIVEIASSHRASERLGTGICLDTPCSHVLTNYHVAVLLAEGMRVEGAAVKTIQLFTGPADAGATEVEASGIAIAYNPARDLALVTLSAPLPPPFARARFAAYRPRLGQPVIRTARFGRSFDVARGTVVTDTVAHRSAKGVVTGLPNHFLLDCPSRPGNSGGAVTDVEGRVLGLVAMRSTDVDGRTGTIAISGTVVSEFLAGADPALWREVFPEAAPVAVREEALPEGLGALTVPAPAGNRVSSLRARAEENARAMRDVIAVENIETWGGGEERRAFAYKIAMYSEGQKYQRIGTAEKEFGTASLKWPRMNGVVPGEQWSIVARLMADASIEELGRSVFEGISVAVFRYRSSAKGCSSRYSRKEVPAMCSGYVVADEAMNTLLVTQTMALSEGHASTIRWSEKFRVADVGGRHVLLPAELRMSGEFRTGKTYYASARWSGYRVFGAESSLGF